MKTRDIAEQLEVFVRVVESGSFSAAGRQLDLAPSSVTRRIDVLEAELGSSLLVRTTHALHLTEMGRSFYDRARHILAEIKLAKAEVRAMETEPEGLLRVDCPTTFGRRHVIPAIADFLQLYPRLNVDLRFIESFYDLKGARVGEEVDVAIRIGEIEDMRLVATVLARQVRIACASPAFLARHGSPATPAQLTEFDCLTWNGPSPSGAWVFGRGKRSRAYPVRARMTSNNSEALLAAALNGLGIVHLQTWFVGEHIQKGELVPLFGDLDLPEPVGATIHALRLEGRVPRKTQLFIDFLKARFSGQEWGVPLRGAGPD